MSALKIIVLVVVIFTSFIIAVGGGPSGKTLGFTYWKNPGAFTTYIRKDSAGRALAFLAATIQACFAYIGTEVVGVAFGETANPRKNIPMAIRQTALRISFFYILGVIVLGMCVPYNNSLLLDANKAKTSAGKLTQGTEFCCSLIMISGFTFCHCNTSCWHWISARYRECIFACIRH